jgi:branched-chain amino acid transport system substrate-binding protein
MLKNLFLLLGLVASTASYAAEPIKIGVLNDQSGVYADYQGVGSVIAAQMAVEDFGGNGWTRTASI